MDNSGIIQASTYEIDINSLEVAKKADMNVKRVGHSIIYVPAMQASQSLTVENGYLYAIGGRTNDSTRTKTCERYNIALNKWEKIANLNHARSKCALAFSIAEQAIYAFFGTDSY